MGRRAAGHDGPDRRRSGGPPQVRTTRAGGRRLSHSSQRRPQGSVAMREKRSRGGRRARAATRQGEVVRGSDHSELQHRGEIVAGRPVLTELAVGDAVPVALICAEPPVGGRANPPSSLLLVPAERTRIATMSPSAMSDSMVISRSGQLVREPLDHFPRVRWTMNLTRFLATEGRDRVLDVVVTSVRSGGGVDRARRRPHEQVSRPRSKDTRTWPSA